MRCRLLVLSYVFLCLGTLSAEGTGKPYITCSIRGQLGNQLFKVATVLAYAWDHDLDPIFPEMGYFPPDVKSQIGTDFDLPKNYQRVFFRLNASPLPRPIRHTFIWLTNYDKANIPLLPDLILQGPFQTWKYFHHYRERLLELFAPHPEELEMLQKKHATLLSHPYTVAVHVRTFSNRVNRFIPFIGMSYYEKAMRLFPEEALFVVFSDRINWCKHHFAKINRPIIFIEDQDQIEDLFLMSMLKHHIIGNSTFSWWGAYLNKNPDKIVVAPSHFIRIPGEIFGIPANPNLPEWITLPIDLKAPYPKDIRKYDARSKSIDTQ